jgi:predicted MFS family arabinose efflux permease
MTVIGLIGARTLFTIGLIPHTIYWVDYLVRGLGHGLAFGGTHWALFGLGAIGGTYLWGRLADRVGFRAGLALAFAALAVGTVLPVLVTAGWALVTSSLVVGAQPGLTAILSGRVHQLTGAAAMAGVWRMSALISTVFQAAAGFGYVALFALTNSYTPIFLVGGCAMAMGAVIACAPARNR